MSTMKNTYDYIVVGAGSAGCILANRLSTNGATTVCLVEAGQPDKSPLIHIPFGIIGLIREGRHNWGYNTEPESHLGNRRLYWPRGKTLGGSSSINACQRQLKTDPLSRINADLKLTPQGRLGLVA